MPRLFRRQPPPDLTRQLLHSCDRDGRVPLQPGSRGLGGSCCPGISACLRGRRQGRHECLGVRGCSKPGELQHRQRGAHLPAAAAAAAAVAAAAAA
jgi:hypothetical protein